MLPVNKTGQASAKKLFKYKFPVRPTVRGTGICAGEADCIHEGLRHSVGGSCQIREVILEQVLRI